MGITTDGLSYWQAETEDIELLETTIGAFLDQRAEELPHQEAIVYSGYPEFGEALSRRWTYAEYRDRANAVAKSLLALGLAHRRLGSEPAGVAAAPDGRRQSRPGAGDHEPSPAGRGSGVYPPAGRCACLVLHGTGPRSRLPGNHPRADHARRAQRRGDERAPALAALRQPGGCAASSSAGTGELAAHTLAGTRRGRGDD